MTNCRDDHLNECKCFVWTPVIVGAFAAIGFSFLLNLFSVAIGLTAFKTNSQGIENLALGGLVATALGIIVSMFAAGWLAGYLGNRYCTKRHIGALYGFMAWCLALIITIYIGNQLTQYIASYTYFISGYTTMYPMANAHNEIAAVGNVTKAEAAMISTYVVFALFFLSAFACSLGGHCGMRHKHCSSMDV